MVRYVLLSGAEVGTSVSQGRPLREPMSEQEKLLREALELLDMVELPTLGSFDGTIFGGPPTSIDLFLPGPKFQEWAEKVRANRRARHELAAPQPARDG